VKVVAIVQARMTSSRLPGKVLADLAGAPMLARVVDRVARARAIDEVWVACTALATDDPIAVWCDAARVQCFRGSESDVLGRYVGAARAAQADVVVRVTADCPLLDPDVVDRVVEALLSPPRVDYAANVLARSYPRGLDVEAFSVEALGRMDRLGRSAAAREHVTVVLRLERPDAFTARTVTADRDDSDLRWTVDTADDLAFVRGLIAALGPAAGYDAMVRWCRAHPALARHDDHERTWDPSRLAGSNGGTR
jgi:spore coat polysaccharide biosynthesis protein SpsF